MKVNLKCLSSLGRHFFVVKSDCLVIKGIQDVNVNTYSINVKYSIMERGEHDADRC